MIIIVSGSIGRLPVGGHAWIQMQYLAGFAALGHEVYFLEDCGEGSWVYHWETDQITSDIGYPTDYIRRALRVIGLENRWLYRYGEQSAGMPLEQFRELCSRADLLLFRAVPPTVWRVEYDLPLRRAFVDADPGFTQVALNSGDGPLRRMAEKCETLLTIGVRLGQPDCGIPTAALEWRYTLPPIALHHWPVASDGTMSDFTSVMHWQGHREVVYGGVRYGRKDLEFPKFRHLPAQTSQRFTIALTGLAPEELTKDGWNVVPGWIPSATPESYRSFIQQSRAEFGVAKQGYVAMRSGWFSDRSVCYLASGRPVLVQNTGLDWLPVGCGVVTFDNAAGALAGVEAINADYDVHRGAARRIAEDYFSSTVVLHQLLEDALG